MTVEKVNPDSTVLEQVQEHWQKLLTLVVWKLARKNGVRVSHKDIEAFRRESQANGLTLLTHGHTDSIDFKIVTRAEAEQLAAYDRTQKGHA